MSTDEEAHTRPPKKPPRMEHEDSVSSQIDSIVANIQNLDMSDRPAQPKSGLTVKNSGYDMKTSPSSSTLQSSRSNETICSIQSAPVISSKVPPQFARHKPKPDSIR